MIEKSSLEQEFSLPYRPDFDVDPIDSRMNGWVVRGPGLFVKVPSLTRDGAHELAAAFNGTYIYGRACTLEDLVSGSPNPLVVLDRLEKQGRAETEEAL